MRCRVRIPTGLLLLICSGAIVMALPLSSPVAEPVLPALALAATFIPLPLPNTSGTVSLEAALAGRRSVRTYGDKPLALPELSQLLWAVQGITDRRGFRTAPSAGALFPLEVFVFAGAVTDLPAGVYQYQPAEHRLVRTADGDHRGPLAKAALGQAPVRAAPAVIVIAADQRRTTVKYGERGVRYVHFEAGHAAQNIALQAVALGLGSVMIGAFSDEAVASLLQPPRLQPLYLVPVGRQ